MTGAEEWRAVVGHEGVYEVSSLGRVRRSGRGTSTFPGKILNGGRADTGYRTVALCYQNKPKTHHVHHLVAAAFLGPCPAGHDINHKDGIRERNCVENLEYVTRSANLKHGAERHRRLGLVWRAPIPAAVTV